MGIKNILKKVLDYVVMIKYYGCIENELIGRTIMIKKMSIRDLIVYLNTNRSDWNEEIFKGKGSSTFVT